MIIDFRSDTVTKPTPEMLEAMMSADVGDDVYDEDPTVNALQQKCIEMFGVDAALFCPSGTMTNQIGINVLSQPYEEVICYENAHIYKYEGGGVAGTSGLSFKLIAGDRGRLTANEVEKGINPDDIHAAKTSIVALENTVNKGGGSYYEFTEIEKIYQVCKQHGLRFHMDGARLFNALIETKDDPKLYGKYFDTISICLSKGLGAPVGSVLLGREHYIKQAKRVRKFMGGGMRQAGYLAAAGLFALENNVERLRDDHRRAQLLGEVLRQQAFVKGVLPVDTNIVIFELADGFETQDVLAKFKAHNLWAGAFGPREIRLVTHLDITDEMLEKAIEIIKQV